MDGKRGIRLAAFDMDGVLTTVQSSWKYVHDRFGVDNSRNLSRYLRGEINYEQFMISDVDLWLEKMGKVHSDSVKNILGEIPIRSNLAHAVRTMKENGITVAIVSGGISWLSDKIDSIAGFDAVYANELLTDKNGYLTRKCVPRVAPEKKGLILKEIMGKLGLEKEECVAIGDSVMDRSMFEVCGTSIAFNPESSEVSKYTTGTLVSDNLDDLLPYIVV